MYVLECMGKETSHHGWKAGGLMCGTCTCVYACVQRELDMVYVRVSGYYFANTDYVEPTRQSAQRGATQQTVRNIL
jgi:hypothetical protein